jgi:hypothetical protein
VGRSSGAPDNLLLLRSLRSRALASLAPLTPPPRFISTVTPASALPPEHDAFVQELLGSLVSPHIASMSCSLLLSDGPFGTCDVEMAASCLAMESGDDENAVARTKQSATKVSPPPPQPPTPATNSNFLSRAVAEQVSPPPNPPPHPHTPLLTLLRCFARAQNF